MPMDFPATNSTLVLAGPAGRIQAALELPAVFQAETATVLICHPHPPDGGSMSNKVVSTLAKAFVDSGYAALRFNFRGVGESEGAYDGGPGELADTLAVADWLKHQRPHAPVALAGFSFGAWLALLAAAQVSPYLMVSIAPPVGFRDFAAVPPPGCPWLAVQGLADEIVSAEHVLAWLQAQQPKPQIIAMPETSHFFHGKLVPLRQHVSAFLQSQPAP
jgi:alpha/beta superfamily hydrolase